MSATFYDTGYIHESRHVRSTCDFDIPLQVQIFVCKPFAGCCSPFLPFFLLLFSPFLPQNIIQSLRFLIHGTIKNLDKMNFFRNYYFFISNIFIYCSICILINGCITFCILDKGGSLMNINKLLLIIIRRRQIA